MSWHRLMASISNHRARRTSHCARVPSDWERLDQSSDSILWARYTRGQLKLRASERPMSTSGRCSTCTTVGEKRWCCDARTTRRAAWRLAKRIRRGDPRPRIAPATDTHLGKPRIPRVIPPWYPDKPVQPRLGGSRRNTGSTWFQPMRARPSSRSAIITLLPFSRHQGSTGARNKTLGRRFTSDEFSGPPRRMGGTPKK